MTAALSKASIAFLVNGDAHSAASVRAREFATRLSKERLEIAYRTGNKVAATARFLRVLQHTNPDITYVVDMAYSGVIAAFIYKLFRHNSIVIDTGDSICALAQSMGRGRVGLFLTWLLEVCSLRFADRIVVRGTNHARVLSRKNIQAEIIPDGVDLELFRPSICDLLRRQLGLDKSITVGFVGSITWNAGVQMCYGLELIEALSFLEDLPVKAVVIGDGSGLEQLKRITRERGLEDHIVFVGRVPYGDLPDYLNLIDICISTQTNDVVGQVRTTGKLPLYLAAGRFVLATRVGEAAIVLPECMLLDYEGTKDAGYPLRLAHRIRAICEDPEILQAAHTSRSIAMRYFDYSLLARRLAHLLGQVSPTLMISST
jgi:glycosyltransferase involved in cell wall biosynthesis